MSSEFPFASTDGPGVGLWPGVPIIKKFIARQAFSDGEVGVMALDATDADVADLDLNGGNDSAWGSMTATDATRTSPLTNAMLRRVGIFGVAMGDIADDDEGDFLLYGLYDVFCHTATSGTVIGNVPLYSPDASEPEALAVDSAANQKILAVGANATVSGALTTPARVRVWFNGWGFGGVAAS